MNDANQNKITRWTFRPKDPSLQETIYKIASLSKTPINTIMNDCLQDNLIAHALKYNLITPQEAKSLNLNDYNYATPINEEVDETYQILNVQLSQIINSKIDVIAEYILSSKTENAKNDLIDNIESLNQSLDDVLKEAGLK